MALDNFVMWDRVEDARDLARKGVEVWAPCHLSPERYFVSNLGNVGSCTKDRGFRLMNPMVNAEGRASVGIYVSQGDKHSESCLVYRLVLFAFDGPPPTEHHTDACHGPNGVRDNRLSEIRWGTRSENMQDTLIHARMARSAPTTSDSTPTKRTSWYEGALADESAVKKGIDLYNQKRLTIGDLAVLWGCSENSAANVVKGYAQKNIERSGRAVANGREGENHHAAVCTDAELAIALQHYVDNHWSGVQFADFLCIPQITAQSILSGRTRMNVQRPPGFVYPWPDANTMNRKYGEQHGCSKLTESHIYKVFAQIESGELKDMKAVQQALGVAKGIAYGIVAGRSWSHLTRSNELKTAVSAMQRTVLSLDDQKAVVDALMRGEPRSAIKEQYALSDSKLQAYITKANKKKKKLAGESTTE